MTVIKKILASVGRDVGKLNLSCTTSGNIICCSCCGNSLADSQNKETELLYDPAVALLGVYPRHVKTCPPENLYMNVHSIIEITQLSINR
jgi:hypothetical protein